jgi:hypothetical protein
MTNITVVKIGGALLEKPEAAAERIVQARNQTLSASTLIEKLAESAYINGSICLDYRQPQSCSDYVRARRRVDMALESGDVCAGRRPGVSFVGLTCKVSPYCNWG